MSSARAGARVVLAVRDQAAARDAAASIAGETEVRRLDLADLASVRAFADGLEGDIDVLINNAGVMATPERRTADGFEMQIGTNHLGHFALANLLLPRIRDRVVVVASGAHRMGAIRLDDLNWEQGGYKRLARLRPVQARQPAVHAELQRRLAEAGSGVRAVAAHPGYAATNLQSHTGSSLQHVGDVDRQQADRPERRAGRVADALRGDPGHPGRLLRRPGRLPGGPRPPDARRPQRRGERREVARRLWERSEQLTGVSFPLQPAAA